MEASEVIEYRLATGLFGRKRTLRLMPDYLEYESNSATPSLLTKVAKDNILDFRHEMNWIVWYRFYVGCDFRIDLKTKQNEVLKIRFRSYFRRNKNYIDAYQQIADAMWEYYFEDVVEAYQQKYFANHMLELNGVKLTDEGVWLLNKNQLLTWKEVEVKEYESYFAIYKSAQPDVNKIIQFYEWESEVLFSMLQTLQQKFR